MPDAAILPITDADLAAWEQAAAVVDTGVPAGNPAPALAAAVPALIAEVRRLQAALRKIATAPLLYCDTGQEPPWSIAAVANSALKEAS